MQSANRILFLVFLISSLLFLNSCKDNCKAGDGGDLTIIATLKHHALVIPNLSIYPDTVFVKFNANELPGTKPSDFDKIYVGNPGEDFVALTGLTCGHYYLFAAAFDTTINQRVVGGIPYSTDEESGEISINIPVTEGD